MANNFFLNQDPLLFQNSYNGQPFDDSAFKRQMNDAMLQYKTLQQQQQSQNADFSSIDYLGNLDNLMKSLNSTEETALSENTEYQRLNAELTNMIQKELMASIRWRINSNPVASKNIERQMEIIKATKDSADAEQRKNLNEINDYVKNYSNITFDEYRRIKNGENKTGEKPKAKNISHEN